MLKLNDNLINSYEKLVYSIITRYANDSNREDLFQVGMVGILDASKKYNKNSGVKFTSFAYKFILGEVLKYLREDRNIRISRDMIRDYRNILIVKEKIYKDYGRPATIEEIGKILNINSNKIGMIINYNEKEVSINKNIDDDDKISLEDTLFIEENLDRNDLILLRDAIKELPLKEKQLIYERYFQNKSQTEFAKENKMSQVKVYRYERKILDKLKDKMS